MYVEHFERLWRGGFGGVVAPAVIARNAKLRKGLECLRDDVKCVSKQLYAYFDVREDVRGNWRWRVMVVVEEEEEGGGKEQMVER